MGLLRKFLEMLGISSGPQKLAPEPPVIGEADYQAAEWLASELNKANAGRLAPRPPEKPVRAIETPVPLPDPEATVVVRFDLARVLFEGFGRWKFFHIVQLCLRLRYYPNGAIFVSDLDIERRETLYGEMFILRDQFGALAATDPARIELVAFYDRVAKQFVVVDGFASWHRFFSVEQIDEFGELYEYYRTAH